MTEKSNARLISGFWRRIFAILVDSIVLGIIGFTSGIFFGDFFVQIGSLGRIIGFFIMLMYLGVLNSNIANGQTLGKRLLKIRVVDSDNNPITLARSFVRCSVLNIPFLLNGATFSDEFMNPFFSWILLVIVFGGTLSTIYLYIFNRITRQSLHDLVVGTYVVNVKVEKQSLGKVWKPHFVIVGLFFIASILIPVFMSNLIPQKTISELTNIRKDLIANPYVIDAGVFIGKSSMSTVEMGTKETTYLSAEVFLNDSQALNDELARTLARSLVDNYKQVSEKDVIMIYLIYGYDIGIWKQWMSSSHKFSPSEL